MARPAKDEPTGFAELLKAKRVASGMTQQQLAEAAGLGRFTIAKLEQGQREPNLPTVLALARALGIKPGKLVDGLE